MRWLFAHRLVASLAIMVGAWGSAFAADMPTKAPMAPAPAIPGWTFSLAPYAWAIFDGSTKVKGRTTGVDANFFQILDHTQFPKGLLQLAALGEARYDRFALLTDIIYMKLGLGASITRTRGTDEIGGAVGVSAGLTVEMVLPRRRLTKSPGGMDSPRHGHLPRSISMLAACMVAARGRANKRIRHAEHLRPHLFEIWRALCGKERELVRSVSRRTLAPPVRSRLELLCKWRCRWLRCRQQVLLAGACCLGLRVLPVKNRHMERHARL
jgi:hypothetical protein